MKNLLRLMFVTSFLFLSACGGDKDKSNQGLSYTGNTNPAIIDSSNANEFSRSSYTDNRNSSSASGAASFANLSYSPTQTDADSNLPSTADIVNTILSAVNQIDKSTLSQENHANVRAIISNSESKNGNCGGSSTVTISADDQTGSFTGSLVFNNYCEDMITLNGSMSMSGVIDQNSEKISNLKITLTSLQFKGLGESITMSGEMLVTGSESETEVTMNLLIRDDTLGEVSKLENMRLSMSEEFGYSTINMSGRIYDHQYGHADITTLVTFKTYNSDSWPSSGELLITSTSGTKAKLTAFIATYRVEADTTGDGSYDYSEDFSWED